METPYLCPDCGSAHAEPGDAALGHLVRCLDCQVEADLALELAAPPIATPVAA